MNRASCIKALAAMSSRGSWARGARGRLDLEEELGRLTLLDRNTCAIPDRRPSEPENGQRSADEHDVAGEPHPLDPHRHPAGEELKRARLDVARAHRVIELQNAEREECGEGHPGEPEVQRPEGE